MPYNHNPMGNGYAQRVPGKKPAKLGILESSQALTTGVGSGTKETVNSSPALMQTSNATNSVVNSGAMSQGGRTSYNGQGVAPSTALTTGTNLGTVPTGSVAGVETPGVEAKTTSATTTPTMAPIQPADLSAINQTLPPKNQPTIYDFIEEAKKLGAEGMQNQIDILKQSMPEFQQGLARQLYGQNVGVMSGTGGDIVSRATNDYLSTLNPYIKQSGTELAQMSLENQQKEVDNLFSLVESGQLTGPQAENVLKQKGIDPQQYMTPEQVIAKQADDQLNELKKQFLSDPKYADYANLVDGINSIEEYNYVLENGRTFEDEMAEIFTTKKSLGEWEKLINSGELQKQVSRLEQQVANESAKSSNWLPWDKPNDGMIGKWNMQLNAIKEIVASVKAGKLPIQDIEAYNNLSVENAPGNNINKILFGGLV